MAEDEKPMLDPETPITQASEHCRRVVLACAGGTYPRDRESALRELAQLRILQRRITDAEASLHDALGKARYADKG